MIGYLVDDTFTYFEEQRARFEEQRFRFLAQRDCFLAQQQSYLTWLLTHMSQVRSTRQLSQQHVDGGPGIEDIATLPVVAVRPAPSYAVTDVTDQQWQAIAPLLQRGKKAGRPPADARVTLNGILYVLHTQCAWRALPERYGNYVTCWRRLLRWQNDGTWPRIARILGLASFLAIPPSRFRQQDARHLVGAGQLHR